MLGRMCGVMCHRRINITPKAINTISKAVQSICKVGRIIREYLHHTQKETITSNTSKHGLFVHSFKLIMIMKEHLGNLTLEMSGCYKVDFCTQM